MSTATNQVGREINGGDRVAGGHNRSVIETHQNNLDGGQGERVVTEQKEDSLMSAAAGKVNNSV